MNEQYEMGPAYKKKMKWGFLLTETYRIYSQRFWTLFRIGLPIAVAAYFVSRGTRFLINQFIVHYKWFPGQAQWTTFTIAIGFISGGLYWVLSTIFFATVTANVTAELDEATEVWRIPHAFEFMAQAYKRVWQRIGSLIAIGCVSWILFFIARGAVTAAVATLLERLHVPLVSIAWYVFLGLPVLILVGLLARLALAVPELMDNPGMTVRESIRVSIRRTENWEPFFIVFFAKSAIAGYAIYWLAKLGFNTLWQHTSISPSAYWWLTWAVYICIAAALESPIFIMFSVLHRELKAKPAEVLTAQAIG